MSQETSRFDDYTEVIYKGRIGCVESKIIGAIQLVLSPPLPSKPPPSRDGQSERKTRKSLMSLHPSLPSKKIDFLSEEENITFGKYKYLLQLIFI
jgi:hypothetical protein